MTPPPPQSVGRAAPPRRGQMTLPGFPACRPERVGLDGESLRLHTGANARFLEMGLTPGVAECVLKDNRLAYADVRGCRDIERGAPMTPSSLHRCYSLTKPVTGFGLMVLYEEGKLRLDDPVSKYIPSFQQMRVYKDFDRARANPHRRHLEDAVRPITLRHLVTHTSGLSYGPMRMDRKARLCRPSERQQIYEKLVRRVDAGKVQSLEALCDELARLPLLFQPGERYRYSMGMDVIGRVLEVVSGMPLDRFLRERVFGPIGMRDTAFFVSARTAARKLTGLYNTEVRGKDRTTKKPCLFRFVRRDGSRAEQSSWVVGHTPRLLAGGGARGSCDGGLVTSLRDQALFCGTVVNLGLSRATGMQVLQPATARLMCKNWLHLKSVTNNKSFLSGWHDDGGDGMGWCPLGFHTGSGAFMGGGMGSWSIHFASKTAIVSFMNAWSTHDIHGWDEKIDELEGCVWKAAAVFEAKGKAKAARQVVKRPKRRAQDGPTPKAKRARTSGSAGRT